MKKPTLEQEKVITCSDPAFLVTSRPGRGKTTVALWFAERLIGQELIHPTQRVLFLTFSRNAVYQISTASGALLKESISSRIDVATYHSFMWWLLRIFGRYSGLPRRLQLMWDMKSKAVSYGACSATDELPLFLACTIGGITYDCFAPLATTLLGSIRLRQTLSSLYPVVIIDEFQDTDDEQWKFIKLLAESARLCCLADPDQMIHRFRGATDDRLNQFLNEKSAKLYRLQTKCLRTDDHELLDFAEAVLDNTSQNGISKGWDKRFLREYQGPNALGFWLKCVLREFYRDYRQRGFDGFPTIAIAAYANRSTGLIRDELKKKNGKINYSYSSVLLESDQDQSSEDLIIHLAFWIGLRSQEDLKLAMKMIGALVSPDNIDQASDPIKTLFFPEEILSKKIIPKRTAKIVTEALTSWTPITSSAVDVIDECLSILAHLSKSIARLANRIQRAEIKDRFGFLLTLAASCDNGNLEEQLTSFKWKLNNMRLQQSVLQRVMPIKGRVVATMHKLKGKEFDYVLLVAMPKDKFYSAGESEIDGRRLVYVGLTRARYDARILYMTSAPPPLLLNFLVDKVKDNESDLPLASKS